MLIHFVSKLVKLTLLDIGSDVIDDLREGKKSKIFYGKKRRGGYQSDGGRGEEGK